MVFVGNSIRPLFTFLFPLYLFLYFFTFLYFSYLSLTIEECRVPIASVDCDTTMFYSFTRFSPQGLV